MERKWRIISDYLGNDPLPYTTKQLFDYAEQSNIDNVDDPDWVPFELVDDEDQILDLSHQRGDEGYIAAVLFD